MTDFETLQDNVVSASCEDTEPLEVEQASIDSQLYIPTPPLVDTTDNDLMCVNAIPEVPTPTSTTGIEEVPTPGIEPEADEWLEAIVDGFPGESTKPHVMNGSATTPTMPSTTTDEGFEELTATKEELSKEKKEDSLKSPLALWMMKQNLHPQVISLIYWVELQRTTGVFGGILFLLICLRFYSVIGVVTTFALSLLVVAFLYRIGMTIVKAVQKTSAEHPFKHLLEEKMEISEEAAQQLASDLRVGINDRIKQAQHLFLVKDTVASLKAMVLFWLISYIAGCINFITICILGNIVIFTIPKLYEEKQAQIDQLFSLMMSKTCMLCTVIEQKLPEKIKIYLKKDKAE